MRQRPQLLHHAVLRAAHRPDPVAGVVGPELHRHRPFQHRANALVHRLGRGPLRVPDRGRDLQNVAARHRPASCQRAGTRSRRKHTPPLPGQAAGRAEGRPHRVRLRQSRPRDIDRAPLVGRRTAGLGGRSGDKAGPFEIVTVVRTCRKMERARTIRGNWAQAPAASGPSDPARREIACIEQAIRGMDDAVIEEHGGLQGLPRADRSGGCGRGGSDPPFGMPGTASGRADMGTPMPSSAGGRSRPAILPGRVFSAAAGRRIASSTDRPAGVSALPQRTGRGPAENARPWAAGNVEP